MEKIFSFFRRIRQPVDSPSVRLAIEQMNVTSEKHKVSAVKQSASRYRSARADFFPLIENNENKQMGMLMKVGLEKGKTVQEIDGKDGDFSKKEKNHFSEEKTHTIQVETDSDIIIIDDSKTSGEIENPEKKSIKNESIYEISYFSSSFERRTSQELTHTPLSASVIESDDTWWKKGGKPFRSNGLAIKDKIKKTFKKKSRKIF
ncbi:hypothetical protein SNEBB_006566 [Seison nebaliae]|nr:hypothetical protein SNEBB_006566 [Seison nebaliae]